VKTFLLLAAVTSIAAGKITTATSFNAVISPDQKTASDANGVASFKVENEAIRYDVKLTALKQITDVVLLTGSKTIQLYSGTPSQHDGLEASGILTEAQMAGLSVPELTAAMESGQARVVVFTTKKPDGSIGGKVVPVPDTESPVAPAPKTTA
jgi:hypothetical protein